MELDKDIRNPLDDVVINPIVVMNKLDRLKFSKSSGSDEMHPRVLKELGPAISSPLACMIVTKRERGAYLRYGKHPVSLPSIRKDPSPNVEQISLTSTVCKAMESIIRYHVMGYVMENNLHGAWAVFVPLQCI